MFEPVRKINTKLFYNDDLLFILGWCRSTFHKKHLVDVLLLSNTSLFLLIERALSRWLFYAENDTIADIETDKLIDGLTHLMACYYVFNVEYPSVCKTSLFFLQEIVMGRHNGQVMETCRE